jgi:hypothetical protein
LKVRRRGRLVVLLILISLGLAINHSSPLRHLLQTAAQSPPTAFTSIHVTAADGTNHTDDVGRRLQTVTFRVNATNSPPVNTFSVLLDYNTTILSVKSVTYSDSVLGPDAVPVVFCIDGNKQPASRADCSPYPTDAPGVIHLAMNILGNKTVPVTSKGLFYVTFNIIGTGLAQLHIANAQLIGLNQTSLGPVQVPIPLLPFGDGYYTNLDCPVGSAFACRPPIISIAYSPKQPSQGTAVSFNVTAIEKNGGGSIVLYSWDWGDDSPSQNQSSTSQPDLTQPIQHRFVTAPFGGIGACVASGNCTVTLSVFDSEGIVWKTTVIVSIFRLYIALSVGEISLDPRTPVQTPGTQIHLNATIVNSSTIAETASLNITLEGKTLLKTPTGASAKAFFTLQGSGGTGNLAAVWDTSGAVPRVYGLVVTIGNVSSAQKQITVEHPEGQYLTSQNDTSNNVRTVYLLLVTPQVAGTLSLSILQTTGVGIIILAAAVLALMRFRKKPSYESEPL